MATSHIPARGTDRDDELVSRITYGVADLEGCSVDELEPLCESIDVEALLRLVDDRLELESRITFCYEGHMVHVEGSGDVVVEET